MSSNSTATLRAAARTRADAWIGLSYVLIGVMALLPRALDLGAYLNIDEAMFWLRRSETFLNAVRAGNFAATAISTHPGVTTMWLGSAGLLLRDALSDSGLVAQTSFASTLAIVRLPLALAHAAGVLLGYGLLRRLLPAAAAVLAAALWALDPFVVGYSRMLHVDGLAATFATLSLLAACDYWHHRRRPTPLTISGVCAGLAILSKSPALALLPVIGLVALAAPTEDGGPMARPKTKDQRLKAENQPLVFGPWSFGLRRLVRPLLAWGLVTALTIFALWPALWVGSSQTFEQLRLGVVAEGAGTHVGGNFFMGREDDRPGPLFYPVALALRLTPWTLLGLLALPLALHQAAKATRRDLATLAGFAVLFVVALSVFSKKLNRYLVPAFPAIDILAAVGLVALAQAGWWLWARRGPRLAAKAERHTRTLERPRSHTRPGLVRAQGLWAGLIVVAAAANAMWWHPYGEVAFNQVLGGAQAGARTFFYGTGEGMQLVAAWLNEQPDITGVITVGSMVPALQPYLRPGAQAIDTLGGPLPAKAGYVVVYGRQSQRERTVPPFDQFYGHATPLHIVTIHGVDYAWIYQAPPPVEHARPASFGPAIRLRGFDGGPARRGEPLRLVLSWEAQSPPPGDAMLFAHLIGPGGRRYAQLDLPYATSGWQPGRFVATELPIAIPADAPAGAYQLAVGLYDPANGQRLALTADSALEPSVDGPDALLLTEFELK
jgi:4-amino-4-deoxy-L-arabinose transferase-like glycosyltransferase